MKLLLSLVVCLDSMGLPVMVWHEQPFQSWLILLGFHLVCSAGIGWTGRRSLPAHYQQPVWSVTALFMGLALFIPMLGAPGVLMMVVLAGRQSSDVRQGTIQELGERRYIREEQRATGTLESGDFQNRLSSQALPVSIRLNTLGKLQGFQARHTSSLFRGALQDEVEEIRLLAFGVLDKKEQAISARIQEELDRLKQAASVEEQREHARQLAYAYWEFVYAELSQGDVMNHALLQAKQYAEQVLERDSEDAGMWALLGQIHLRLHDKEQASSAFRRALEGGIPETRVLPYLAELAFQQRKFSATRQYLANKTILADVPILQPVVDYWCPRPGESVEIGVNGAA